MNEGPFLTKLAEIVHLPVAELSSATEIDPTSWESIEVLDIIAAVDESYGVTIPLQSLTACRTMGELRLLIEKASVA